MSEYYVGSRRVSLPVFLLASTLYVAGIGLLMALMLLAIGWLYS